MVFIVEDQQKYKTPKKSLVRSFYFTDTSDTIIQLNPSIDGSYAYPISPIGIVGALFRLPLL